MVRFLFLLTFLSLTPYLQAQKAEYLFQVDRYQGKQIMKVSTVTKFACSNNGIFIRQAWSRDTLIINILGIDIRKECNNIVGPAKETILINGIRSKEFFIRFISERKMNFFSAEYDGETFDINSERSDFMVYVTN